MKILSPLTEIDLYFCLSYILSMKIILAGGGTLGSVSPLIAIWQKIKEKENNVEVLFIGTKNGPEKEFVRRYNLSYQSILAGKFRRYFSLLNLVDVFIFTLSIFQSFNLLRKFKPDLIISAGSFVAVPLIWASRLFKVKVILYQSDLRIGLANRLCQKFADKIYTAFPETVKEFKNNRTKCLGTLLRQEITQISHLTNNKQRATILVLGGGTGSVFINQLIIDSLPELTKKYQVIHVTGFNKGIDTRDPIPEIRYPRSETNYQNFELLNENYYQTMADADLVICRAGVSTLLEISYLAKPAILIPLPNSAQEQNADYFCQRNAAVCLNQKKLTSEKMISAINQIFQDKNLINQLSQNIKKIFKHNGIIDIS
jgi:UDP-N-acetylglucosamine--N-acetylmuramyl-(pentapeptide) pyrophosphoryl-undecaprenol N-acetylglucosamine transferase